MNPILAAPLAAVLLVAVATDLRAMRIPNWLTFPAMLAGVVCNAALGAHAGGLSGAWDGLLFSLSGFGLGLGLMLIPFLLRVMGAGDVKLLAAAGAFLGAETVFRAFIWTSLAGGVYALGVLASVFHFANGLWSMGITWGVWTSPKAQRWVKLPAAAVGVLLLVVGFGALVGFIRYPVAAYAPSQPVEHRLKAPGTLETPEAETVMFRGGHDRVESKEHEGPVQK